MRKLTALALGTALALSMVGSAFAATDTQNANTTLNVNASITLTGLPATIDFGSGIVGDVVAAPQFTLNVETNNTAGYSLKFKASDMVSGTPVETIPATAMTIEAATTATGATGSANAALAAADTYQVIGSSTDRSVEAGDDFAVDVDLTIPFVRTATYTGTAAAEASTL